MQIGSLTDIVEGRLKNIPSISFITQVHTEVSKINEGDAFFAIDHKDIPKAIEKGAFAVIFENKTDIVDDEIAWIEVDNLTKSIANVLRYKLLEYKNQYILTNKFFIYLLKIFKSKELSYVVTLNNNLSDNFELLNAIDENKLICSTDSKFLNNIATDIVILEDKKFELKNLTIHSLFEITFSYKERYFDRLKIPRVYVDYLLQVLELFEYKLDIKRLSHFNLFKPVFINKSNQIAPFGQTNRFILANEDIEICEIEINYLKTHYSYGNITIINTINLINSEIFNNIKDLNFNALYLIGSNIKDISKILEQNYNEHKFIGF